MNPHPHPLTPRDPPRGPLAGIGVVVTRPARQAGAFAQKLAALGATPIVWPAIVILPPDDPARLAHAHAALDRYDLAFFVSANAAEYGAPPVGRWPPQLRAYAPGPGTAEALAGVEADGAAATDAAPVEKKSVGAGEPNVPAGEMDDPGHQPGERVVVGADGDDHPRGGEVGGRGRHRSGPITWLPR